MSDLDPGRPADASRLAGRIAERLVGRGETVAIVESSAAGLIAASLLEVAGASRFFLGGAVVYTEQARSGLLGIDLADHPGLRSASEPYAALLARTIRERLGATWALAETGAAGPAGNRYGDAAGHVCLAVDGPLRRVGTLETGLADRSRNMRLFADAALAMLDRALEG